MRGPLARGLHELVDEDVVAGLPLPASVPARRDHEPARRVNVEVTENAAVVTGHNGEGDPGNLPAAGATAGGAARSLVETQVVETDIVLTAAEQIVPGWQGADTADATGGAGELHEFADLGRISDVVLFDCGISPADKDGVSVDRPRCRHAPWRGAGRDGDLLHVVRLGREPGVPDADTAVDRGRKEDVVRRPQALVGPRLQ